MMDKCLNSLSDGRKNQQSAIRLTGILSLWKDTSRMSRVVQSIIDMHSLTTNRECDLALFPVSGS